jgi:hypothetical protein
VIFKAFGVKLEAFGYPTQLQALPFGFTAISSERHQTSSLRTHAEKRALAELIRKPNAVLEMTINFKMCADCHKFMKSASRVYEKGIIVEEPRLRHKFQGGSCSCLDDWRWEARPEVTKGRMPEMSASDFEVSREAARELFRTGVDGAPIAATADATVAASAVEATGAAAAVKGTVEEAALEEFTAAVERPAHWAEMSATQKKNWRGRQSRAAKWTKGNAAAAEGACDAAAASGSNKGAAAAAKGPSL